MGDKVVITAKILKWARESARMSLVDAAAKVPVDAVKLQLWEEGTNYPTMAQLEKLAKAYRRPVAIFFLPELPLDFQPLQDFRNKSSAKLGTASVFIIREVQQRQAWTSEIFKENDYQRLDFVGRYTLSDDPKVVARDMIQTLAIDPTRYEHSNPLLEWIRKAEARGIFVCRTSFVHSRLKLNSDEMQGFTIADNFAPFIFINSEDWDAPQLFTMVHELAHVWIAQSGISNEVEVYQNSKAELHPVEAFCNSVAAEVLMPEIVMRQLTTTAFQNDQSVFLHAKKMAVSSFAFLIRALKLGLIENNRYIKLKKEADEGFREYAAKEAEHMAQLKAKMKALPKEERSGPNSYLLLANKNGQLFTRVVMDAFRGGTLLPTEASRLLSTKVNNFSKLEAVLYI